MIKQSQNAEFGHDGLIRLRVGSLDPRTMPPFIYTKAISISALTIQIEPLACLEFAPRSPRTIVTLLSHAKQDLPDAGTGSMGESLKAVFKRVLAFYHTLYLDLLLSQKTKGRFERSTSRSNYSDLRYDDL
jgi:hypothetical protein